MLVGVGLPARQVDVDDVEGRAGEQGGALLDVDDVVGRSDEVLERPGHAEVVVEGAEGLEVGHLAADAISGGGARSR